MIFTDPPFEMSGKSVLNIINKHNYNHLVLICSMHQALDMYKLSSNLDFCFATVIEHMTPSKTVSYNTPHMIHSNVVYFRKKGIKTAFDRRLIHRHDCYSDNENNHYYPSIFHSPKINMEYKYQKNQSVINDILGSFKVSSVLDTFAGSGTAGIAAIEHGMTCHLVEFNKSVFLDMQKKLELLFGSKVEIVRG